uniref:Uncharacterized protein n=1 Tax=Saimiri boliviensis boliviensis TaxID=39432 RepID=A0A2K6U784_SAIBB
MLWLTNHLVVYIFCRSWPTQRTVHVGLLGVATADRMGNSLFVLSGKKPVFVKMSVTFHIVLPFSKRPSVRGKMRRESEKTSSSTITSVAVTTTTSPARTSRKQCQLSFLST